MNRVEALSIKDDVAARGYDAHIVTSDDGECGVAVHAKAGPTVGIDRVEFLEAGLEMIEELS